MPEGSSEIVIAPMTAAEFAEYAAETVPAYAQDKVQAGQWTEEDAPGPARADFAALLPVDVATPDHYLFTARDAETQEEVGTLWFAVQKQGGRSIAYVYDIAVRPHFQRRGHATQLLAFLEGEARARGLSGIGLHVFGHNGAAQALYAKLGFQPTSIHMFKAFGPEAEGD